MLPGIFGASKGFTEGRKEGTSSEGRKKGRNVLKYVKDRGRSWI